MRRWRAYVKKSSGRRRYKMAENKSENYVKVLKKDGWFCAGSSFEEFIE